MVMYTKPDIIRFISIKCNCSQIKAKEMLDAFYEFVDYTIRNGDAVSCQPLGIFDFRNINSHYYNFWTYDYNNHCRKHLEGISSPYTKPIFRMNKGLIRDVKIKTKNNQWKLLKDCDDLLEVESDNEDEEVGTDGA